MLRHLVLQFVDLRTRPCGGQPVADVEGAGVSPFPPKLEGGNVTTQKQILRIF